MWKQLFMSHRLIIVGSVLITLASLTLLAAEKHNGHTAGMSHNAMLKADVQLQEGGQATFAALIEIVGMLERNPETDWDSVDISALRSHLVDMNHLILNTTATHASISDTQIRFDILGTTASMPSIIRMVPAHSKFIEQSRGWSIEPELLDAGATLTITVPDSASLKRLKALGFYGFMSLDSHHQAHHYQMAKGSTH